LKKTGKVFIIVALCMIVFGTILAAGAWIAIWTTGASWASDLGMYDARAQSHELDSITSLDLDLIDEPVYIVRGGDKVTIEWSQRYDGQYSLNAAEGGTLSLSRGSYGWFNIDIRMLDRAWWYSHIEDGLRLPVTVTIPEGMDLNRISLNGVNIRVTMDNIDARRIDANGVDLEVIFRHDDISQYSFQTNGLRSILRIDGRRTHRGIGYRSYNHPGAWRHITVGGVNAELDVRQN
jgi:hypothetical protein